MPPVPVYVKGGVWTNVEDQILKAAIQKYGTHQWSKVASLLYKKSARQCEVRWKEFLDPQLNFSDFTKEEDSRLLLLARRLPNQWRSIAELLGRTAQACIERYNRLLAFPSSSSSSLPTLNLRVGELNPSADTQVARPDREEFDEDEREMLADAKARLLNTQGKKATRRVRERMLEESKRIAELQRRRELKQAGIQTSLKRGRKKYSTEIDYNEDVIYEQAPLPGFYDTSEEDKLARDRLLKFEAMIKARGLSERTKETGKRNKEKDDSRSDLPRENGGVNRGKRSREWSEHDETSIGKTLAVTSGDDRKFDTFRELNEGKRLKLSAPDSTVLRTAEETVNMERKKLLERIAEPSIFSRKSNLEDTVTTDVTDAGSNHIQEENKILNADMRKRLLHQLLEALPTPKNDFDIVYDAIEEENEEIDALTRGQAKGSGTSDSPKLQQPTPPPYTVMENEPLEASREENTSTVYSLECLANKGLPVPEFKENPTSLIEQKYNELISNAINGTQYTGSTTTLQCLDVLDRHIKTVAETLPMDARLPHRKTVVGDSIIDEEEREQLLENIRFARQRIYAARDELQYVEPLIERNNLLSKRLCGESLPKLNELQTKFYIQYKLYSRESHALKRRELELENVLKDLVSG